MNEQRFNETIWEVFRLHRRIGFRDAKIEIAHCLIGSETGFEFTLYDDNYGNVIELFSLTTEGSQNIILYDIAKKFAFAIKEKTGLNVKVIKEIQGSPMEYDEKSEKIAEKMWIARMAMQGIDDDY
jgi:hypothetical protein